MRVKRSLTTVILLGGEGRRLEAHFKGGEVLSGGHPKNRVLNYAFV